MLMDGGIFPLSTQYLPVESGQGPDGIPERIPDEILMAAREDDTFGSGIFDDYNNTNTRDGIFADRNSVPGYVGRETGTGFSEVVDWQTGNPIVSLADGLRSGQIQGGNGYSSAPPYPAHAGASYPDIRTIASQVDFVGPAVPMSNDWAAQVATAQQPPFDARMPYPIVDPSTFGIQGSQGMSRTGPTPEVWANPLLPANAGELHPDMRPFGQAPARNRPSWHGARDLAAFRNQSHALVGGQGPRAGAGGIRLGPEGSSLPDPQSVAVNAMRPRAQFNLSTAILGGQTQRTSNISTGQQRQGQSAFAPIQMPREKRTSNISQTQQRKPMNGLGGFAGLGEFSIPGGDIGRYFVWGVLGGVTAYIFANVVLGVDLVKEAKGLVELEMSYITPAQEVRTDQKYSGLGAFDARGGRASLSSQYGYAGLGAFGIPYTKEAQQYGAFGTATSDMTVGDVAVGLGSLLAMALLQVGCGYYVGQHLARNAADKTKYGIAGAVIFGVTNPGIIASGALVSMAYFGSTLWPPLSSAPQSSPRSSPWRWRLN